MQQQEKRIIKLPKVKDKIGLGRTTIYQMITDGGFPAPISLGTRAVGWLESEVDQWIQERAQHRRLPKGAAIVGVDDPAQERVIRKPGADVREMMVKSSAVVGGVR